jgi:4-oxalmesaconate hydratase
LVPPSVSDDEIRAGISANQLRKMQERGVDLTIFSPRAVGMDHHYGNEDTNVQWARYNNDLVHRVCQLYPDHFIGVCQLPQASGVAPGPRVFAELERCILELGFIGANLNPDPSGGRWTDPPLSDRKWWYPLYEKLVELDVPAMIHGSGSCNPHFDPVATHYINGDTTAFVQFMTSDIFKDFPTLKFIIPHGGGAVPYHWGRYRGIAQDRGLEPLEQKVWAMCSLTRVFTIRPALICCCAYYPLKTFCLRLKQWVPFKALIRLLLSILMTRENTSTLHQKRQLAKNK